MATTRAMTLAQMRAYVRDQLDTDALDLPDTLIDGWFMEGAEGIENYSDSWAFRAVSYTLNTTINQQAYVFSDVTGLTRASAFDSNLLRIDDVQAPFWSLTPSAHAELRALYTRNQTTTGQPRRYSTFGHSLYLWPTPSAVEELRINGFRAMTDWIGLGTTPDFPPEFHHLVAVWGLSQAYAREGDPGMSQLYADQYAAGLARRASHYNAAGTEQPFILNSGVSFKQGDPRGRLLYPWE